MRVYILREHNEYNQNISEIIEVFDSLEDAQAYREGKPEDWQTDKYAKGWWDRKIIVTEFGRSVTLHLSIVEWEVKTRSIVLDEDEINKMYCVACKHTVSEHSKYGCNHDHDKPNWLVTGCTCKITRIHNLNELSVSKL